MKHYDFDIGVIGGGAAGLTVTAGAAQLGAKTIVIEKEGRLGGDCLYYGCVPSKTLIRSARLYHQMKKAERYGLPAGEVLPVDYRAIGRRIESVIGTIQEKDSDERFCSLGARVLYGNPEFIDEYSLRLEGETISAAKWVIATGSSPSVPATEGLNDVPYLTNRDLYSLERLPRSMIILGGGPVGIEMAQAFCRLGTRVSVLQRSGGILTKDDPDLSKLLLKVLEDEGVVFYLNSTVQKVAKKGGLTEVTIKNDRGERKAIEAEKLLVAAGREANLKGLGLEKIGVDYDQRGLKLDGRLRTAQRHIFGAGDVTGTYQFTHAAGYEGGLVVVNAIAHLPQKVNYLLLPWCTYTDPELASIGLNEKTAKETGIECRVWTQEFRDNDRSLAEGEATGRIKMVLDEKERLIGVQILGPQAGELIGEWVAVLNGKVKLSLLARAVHPYPTLGEINKQVAGAFYSSKIFSETVRKGLTFFFHLKGRACFPQEGR